MKPDATLELLAGVCDRDGFAYFRVNGQLYAVMPTADRSHVRVVQPPSEGVTMAPSLTPRQLQALQLSAKGMSPPEVADAMGARPNTVHQHLQMVRRAFRVNRTAEAVVAARALGVIA